MNCESFLAFSFLILTREDAISRDGGFSLMASITLLTWRPSLARTALLSFVRTALLSHVMGNLYKSLCEVGYIENILVLVLAGKTNNLFTSSSVTAIGGWYLQNETSMVDWFFSSTMNSEPKRVLVSACSTSPLLRKFLPLFYMANRTLSLIFIRLRALAYSTSSVFKLALKVSWSFANLAFCNLRFEWSAIDSRVTSLPLSILLSTVSVSTVAMGFSSPSLF